ncbi:hypothetical protein [Methanococcus maripaludis]|uniref:Nicotinamide riboside kinase n=2 Tax=Methanococcus maripaludis TaxID=39152 RepID=A0A7J9PJA4_METMI|nr:hypothetical protein [Methanococcus maripaludis]MBA2862864.1 nicotinamide riboside kinase [Methanococcus maripaludis]
MRKIILGILMVLALVSISYAASEFKDMGKQEPGKMCPFDFQNMTTEEIQEALEEQLAELQDEYDSCEDEQMQERIQERIEMTQGLIDDPEKLEEMMTNMPEREEKGVIINFQNMTTEEIQEALEEQLAELQDEYDSCEDEQMQERIQERIEMTQGLIDDPEKLEEMMTNMPEMPERMHEMPERKREGFIEFQDMTTEEIQEALEEQLAELQDEYDSCEDEQMQERIQERIEMTQSLIDDPEKLEEMMTNMPEMPERHGEGPKANSE